jgi:hypothetical protein
MSSVVPSSAITGTVSVQGDVAAGSADSGFPVKIGGLYELTPTTYADGDRTDVHTDLNGRLLVREDTLDRNTGAAGANTLRVKLTNEDAAYLDQLETYLASIDAGIPAALGQATMANSMPVVLASDQSNLNVVVASSALPTGAATETTLASVLAAVDQLEGYLDQVETLLTSIDAGTPAALGQTTMANSMPVVIASNQSAFPVTFSSTVPSEDPDTENPIKVGARYDSALPTYSNGDKSNLQADVNGRLLVREDTLSRNTGAVDANTLRIKLSDEDVAYLDGIEAALASIDAGIPAALGQATMANSMPVVISSDQSALQSVGNVADNGADSGNPVKVGGRYNLTPPTYADGDRADLQVDANGNLKAALVGSVSSAYLSVVDFVDNAVGPVLDAATNNIQDNAGAFVVLVASLAADAKKIRVADTTGQFLGVYVGAAASEVLAFIINPGQSNEIEHAIPSGSRVTVRAMGASVVSEGQLCLQFLG